MRASSAAWFSQRNIGVVYGVATAVIILMAAGFAVWFWDESIRDGLLGSLLANALALLVGMPVALHLNRLYQKQSEQSDLDRRSREDSRHRAGVLFHLLHELRFNASLVASRQRVMASAAAAGKRGIIVWAPLKVDYWKALASSGEIRNIHNLKLLDTVIHAYFRISIIAMFEEKHLSLMFHPDYSPGDTEKRAVEAQLLDLLSAADKMAATAIEKAMEGISGELRASG